MVIDFIVAEVRYDITSVFPELDVARVRVVKTAFTIDDRVKYEESEGEAVDESEMVNKDRDRRRGETKDKGKKVDVKMAGIKKMYVIQMRLEMDSITEMERCEKRMVMQVGRMRPEKDTDIQVETRREVEMDGKSLWQFSVLCFALILELAVLVRWVEFPC